MNDNSLEQIIEGLIQDIREEEGFTPFETQFVIHDHYATHHHFDLRIKKGKKAPSWALPKAKMPTNTDEKILAVRTPDHSISWMSFEGEIPEGEYGAGTVKIYDKGKCIIYKWTETIVVKFLGDKVKGFYSLIHTNDKNYLIIYMNQDDAINKYEKVNRKDETNG